MASVNHTVSPPGLKTATIKFDFREAFKFIERKVDMASMKHVWDRSVVDALNACYNGRQQDVVPTCQFAFKFLTVLWDLLYSQRPRTFNASE
ncbi:hypothetical protein Hte_003021 [Hypoxylon texense]